MDPSQLPPPNRPTVTHPGAVSLRSCFASMEFPGSCIMYCTSTGAGHFQTCEICRELTHEKLFSSKVQVCGQDGGFKHFLFSPLLGK